MSDKKYECLMGCGKIFASISSRSHHHSHYCTITKNKNKDEYKELENLRMLIHEKNKTELELNYTIKNLLNTIENETFIPCKLMYLPLESFKFGSAPS